MRKFKVTLFKGIKPQGTLKELSWGELCNELSTAKTVTSKLQCNGVVCGTFKDNYRSKDNVIDRSCVMLDIDSKIIDNSNKTNPTTVNITKEVFKNEVVPALKEALDGYAFMIYNTYSWERDNQKIRVVIPLNMDVDSEQYTHISKVLAYKIGIQFFDFHSFQAEQFMFYGGYKGVGIALRKIFDGDFLNPQDLLKEEFKEEWLEIRENAPTSTCKEDLKHINTNTQHNHLNAVQEDINSKNDKISEGSRNDYIFKLACKMHHSGLSYEEAEEICLYYYGKNCEIKEGENKKDIVREIRATVKSAYKNREWLEKDKSGKIQGVNIGLLADELNKKNNYIKVGSLLYHYNNEYWEADLGENKLVYELSNDHTLIPAQHSTANKVRNVANTLKNKAQNLVDDDLNAEDRECVVFKNGIYDIEEDVLKDFIEYKDMYFTSQLQCDYKQPLTKLEDTTFYQFCLAMMNDEETVKNFMEYIGYAMVNTTKFQQMLILQGEGGIGKSVLLNFIQSMFGTQNISNVSLETLAEDKFAGFELLNKKLNVCGDISSRSLNDTAIIKQIIGEDRIRGEAKGKQPIYFKNKAKLIFSANAVPYNKSEQSNAFYRRLIIIPCVKGEYIEDLKDKLAEEIEIIAYYCLQEYIKIKEQGTIKLSPYAQEVRDSYRSDSDTVFAFIKNKLKKSDDKEKELNLKKELYEEYKNYCIHLGRENETKSMKIFKATLINNGFKVVQTWNGENRGQIILKGFEIIEPTIWESWDL